MLAQGVAGCSPSKAKLSVARVVLDIPTSWGMADPAWQPEILRGHLQTLLAGSDVELLPPQSAQKPSHRAYLEGFLAVASSKEKQEARYLRLRLMPLTEDAEGGLIFMGRHKISADKDPSTAQDAALKALWQKIQTQRQWALASSEVLQRKLEAWQQDTAQDTVQDPTEAQSNRAFVLRLLGRMGTAKAQKILLDTLHASQSPQEILTLAGILIPQPGPGVVEALIAKTRRRDPVFVRQIVFAVASMGGDTAKAFLVTLGSGHPNAAIREASSQALAEMD